MTLGYMDIPDNPQCEACQTAAGAIWETKHWRNVRTAQGSVAANGCPLTSLSRKWRALR